MSKKYTPGPWSVDFTGYACFIKAPDSDVVLAEVWGLERQFPDADDEAKANMRVMVTAPELLEVLERIVNYYKPNEDRPEALFKLNKAIEVIKNAEGEMYES